MKKKTVITVVIGVIIALTIITSIYGKNPVYNYVKNKYFPDVLNLEEQYGVKNYKTGNQTIEVDGDRKSTRLNSSHPPESRMPSSA